MFISAVLITGCFSPAPGPTSGNTSEIYNPFTKTSCVLPKLSVGRYYHSQNGGLACGGGLTPSPRSSCVKWSLNSGSWSSFWTLRKQRNGHVSWVTASGVYLIGGSYSDKSSEKVKSDGTVEEGFTLKYYTRLQTLHSGIDISF